MEVLLIDVLTQQREITVVLSIVKQAQMHGDCLLTGDDDPRDLKEGN